ncbi:sugar 3,4-ketoisomerase [Thorsellia kenyensis]|uniref:FdtA/QdtA family cupin domain-containing protein n=1 Tax=Thorsellia kenyensis TaxID=1549888 RepID=A0ABV6C9G7_9GAMM
MRIELIQLQKLGDERGSLVAIEYDKNIPFEIKRVYYLFNTKLGVMRGSHAHKSLQQVAIALSGSCKFILDDGKERVEILLDNPSQGLYIGPGMWREMYDFSPDCILLVLADQVYEENDYIRIYQEFIEGI